MFLQEQINDIIIITKLFARGGGGNELSFCVCFITAGPILRVFYYCRTYYKAVRVGGGGVCVLRVALRLARKT